MKNLLNKSNLVTLKTKIKSPTDLKQEEIIMKTFECVARSGNTGKEIVIIVRAIDPTRAKMDALPQARQQFGNGAGSVTIISVKEV